MSAVESSISSRRASAEGGDCSAVDELFATLHRTVGGAGLR